MDSLRVRNVRKEKVRLRDRNQAYRQQRGLRYGTLERTAFGAGSSNRLAGTAGAGAVGRDCCKVIIIRC